MPISKETLQRIVDNDPTLTSLGERIRATTALELAKALLNNTTLTNLSLRHSEMGTEGAIAIAAALKNTNITSLDLTCNEIKNKGDIISALTNNTNITSLNLSYNEIEAQGAIALANALLTNSTIKNLDLKNNRIESQGAVALAAALKNTNITSLDLTGNYIGDQGAVALAAALLTNTTLTNLNLEFNQITEEGAVALAAALENNLTVTNLELGINPIGSHDRNIIENFIQRNKDLIQISDKIYRSFNEKEQGQNQQNPILSEKELELIATSPRACQEILNQFLSKPDISGKGSEILFNHIKEFPGGLRMLMLSAESALNNKDQPLNNLESHIKQLNLADLFAMKGVAKNINNQHPSPLSKLPNDMLVEVLSYLEIDDIKKTKPQESQMQQEQSEELSPNTSFRNNNQEPAKLDGCLPQKTCTIS